MIIGKLLGTMVFAIIFSVLAYKQVKNGKKYLGVLIVGIVLYGLVLFGNAVGDKDSEMVYLVIPAIILQIIMIPVCKMQEKKNSKDENID